MYPMSNLSTLAAEERSLRDLQVVTSQSLPPVALIIYDYILMLDDEIRLIWCWKPWHMATLFFVCVRLSLFVVAASVLFMAAIYDEHDEASYVLNCASLNVIANMIGLFTIILTATISAMRVYAVSDRSVPLTSLTFALGLVPAGLIIRTLIVTDSNLDLLTLALHEDFCNEKSPESEAATTAGILAPRLCAIASDAMVVATTWRNTYQAARLKFSNDTDSMDYALSWYLMRDGVFYFILMLLLNVFDISKVFVTSGPLAQGDYFSTTMTYPLSLLLISRLLLNLRQAACSSRASSETSGFLDVHSPDEQNPSPVFFDHEATSETTETPQFSPILPSEAEHTDILIAHAQSSV